MKVSGITKAVIVFVIIVAALFGSLAVLGVMTMDVFTDSITKVSIVGLITIVASAIIGYISTK